MNQMDEAKDRARDDEIKEFLSKMKVARAAIMEKITELGQKKKNVTGQIPCPVCKVGTLSYSRAGRFNGHIHANCSTEGCVQWME